MVESNQVPTFSFSPKNAANRDMVDEAIELSVSCGLVLDEWQEYVLGQWLERSWRKDKGVETLRFTSTSCYLAVPRQNGKNAVIEALTLFETVVLGRKVLHTAHEVKTAKKAFRRIVELLTGRNAPPDIKAMVASVRSTNGQEAVHLKNGGSVEFIARTRGSGRGFTVDTIILDEAQDLSDEALEALKPTISASPSGDSHQIFTGTPPGPRMAGEVFTRAYEAAHEKVSRNTAWSEWAVDRDDDPSDENLWFRVNPALGVRLHADNVLDEFQSLSSEAFLRERLGAWGVEKAGISVVDPEDWAACQASEIVPASPVTLSVDVAPDRNSAALVASGLDSDGNTWVDVIEHREGPPVWLTQRIQDVVELQDVHAVVIDRYGNASGLIEELGRRGIKVTEVTLTTVIRATAAFYDAIVSRTLKHIGQASLTAAAISAGRRKTGDAWAWGRPSTGSDITPLVAATMAAYGNEWSQSVTPVKKKRPKRKRRVQRMVVL